LTVYRHISPFLTRYYANKELQWYTSPCRKYLPLAIYNIPNSLTPQSSSNVSYSAAALSLLTSCGGIAGYARTGSIPSIAAGLSVGALYALSFYRLQGQQPYGEELGLLASAVLGGSSIPRAIRSGKPVPVGLSVLATYGLVVFALAYRGKRASAV
jgi:uncharacterized membrane protein (UPF0136 family)